MGTKVTVNTTGGSKVGIKNQQQEVIRTVGVSSAEGLVAYTLADYAMNTAQSAYAQANAAPSIANTYAYSVGISGNNYAGDMANSANGYAVTVGLSGNSYTISVGASSNSYANAIGISGNNYAGDMANSANAWSNTKLSNTSGVVFGGDLNITGNLVIGTGVAQTSNYTLQVKGNTYLTGSVITGKLQHSPVPLSRILNAFDGANDDRFSRSALSSDASVMVVGSPNWEGTTGTNRGGVYTYDWNGSSWVQRGPILQPADAADGDTFGYSVSINGDGTVMAVGALSWEGATGTNRGTVYIFDWNGSSWVQRGSPIEPSDAADNDLLGFTVALSANASVLAIGAYLWEGATGTDRGGVYIFDWNGSSWVQRGSVIEPSDAANGDVFSSVSLSPDGNILAVGAFGWEGDVGANRGTVYIFDWDGISWVQRGLPITPADADDRDQFGVSTALSANGLVLAVGANLWEGGVANSNTGGIYIFDWISSSNTWSQRGPVLETADANNSDQIGASVSLSHDASILTISTTLWEGTTGDARGAVYTYTLTGASPGGVGTHTGSGWIETSNSSLIARTAGLDRINIDVSGNVGIGTTSPTSNLHVVGIANITSNLIVQGSDITQAILSGNNYAGAMINTATVSANNYTGSMVNTATVSANNYAGSMVNTATVSANNYAGAMVNTATVSANNFAGLMANSANGYTVSVGTSGNNYAGAMVNSANAWANTKLSLSGGTIVGDVQVTGNLSVAGNTNFINTTSYIVTDPLLYIAGNNYVSDVVTIGFVGNYNNGACSEVHTGLIRDPGTKQYYLFKGYDKEPGSGNVIDINGNNFTIAVLNSDVVSSNIYLDSSNLKVWLSSINSYVNNVSVSANAWSNTKLANTSGVVFNGDLAIKGNVAIGSGVAQTTSYALQVTGNTSVSGYGVTRNIHVQGGTNLVLYSEQLDNASWTKQNCSISANNIVAPDGTTTADKIIEDSTSGNPHGVRQTIAFTQLYNMLSFYAKKAERNLVNVWGFSGSIDNTGVRAAFDLNAGTVSYVGTGQTASISDVGNGWYRCSVSIILTAASSVVFHIGPTTGNTTQVYLGDGASGIYVWGVQIEPGFVVSPYTQTLASSITSNNTLEVQGRSNIYGDLVVTGNVTLGDASTDTITLRGSTINLGNNQNIDAGTLFVDATNNRVGIGTTAPVGKFDVTGSGSTLFVNSDDNSGTQITIRGVNNANNRLYIGYDTDDNVGRILAITEGVAFRNLLLQEGGGNIGMGIAVPTSKLHVVGTSNITSTAVFGGNVTVGLGGSTSLGKLHLYSPGASQVFKTDESTSGYTYTQGMDDTGIYFRHNSDLRSFRWQTGANSNERMRIDYTGFIGIGTTAPAANLHVIGNTIISGDFSVGGNVTLGDASTDTITLRGSTISLGNNQNIDAGTLFIDAVNNEIGIGTTNPTSNLHVIGTANITSNTVIQGSLNVSCTNASIALTTLYSPTPNTPSILFKQNTDTFRISYNPNNKLSFTGSVTGQELFSIVDSFTNVIYSITTSDGIPVVEIFNSGKLNLGQWIGNVSIGANNTTNTYLQVGNNTTLYSQSISSGGLILSLATKTSAYTLTSNDRTILANASAGGFTLTLPPANNNVGRFYTIKKVDSSANVVTITTTYSQTIDGAALMNLNAQFATLSFQSDNSNWYIV